MRTKQTVNQDHFNIFVDSLKKKKKGLFIRDKTNYFKIGNKYLAYESLKNSKDEVFANIVYEKGIDKPVSYEIFIEEKEELDQLTLGVKNAQ
jgi:hypothetical protein